MKNTSIVWIAWREFLAAKGHGIRFMVVMSVAGIALGVAAMIVVMSVMAGFAEQHRQSMIETAPHLEVLSTVQGSGFALAEHSLDKIQASISNASSYTEFVQSDLVIRSAKKSFSAKLYGLPLDKHKAWPWPFYEDLFGGQEPISAPLQERMSARKTPGILLSSRLAQTIVVKPGDRVSLLNPDFGANQLLGSGELLKDFVVEGVFFEPDGASGIDPYLAVVSIEEGRKFLPGYDPQLDPFQIVSGVAFKTSNPFKMSWDSSFFSESNGFRVETWKEKNSSILFALTLEKYVMAFLLFLVVIVAAFSICGSLIMSSFKKRRQVAIYRAMGMTQSGVLGLFLWKGGILGAVGVFLGASIGWTICLIYWQNGGTTASSGLDVFNLPVKFLPLEYLVICCGAWAMSFIAAVLPAAQSSRLDPVDGLRVMN